MLLAYHQKSTHEVHIRTQPQNTLNINLTEKANNKSSDNYNKVNVQVYFGI